MRSGPPGPEPSVCPKHTTSSSQPSAGFVTITHPHHPLRGQRVEIIRLRRGLDPDLIVRLPDGRHAAIALSSTDYLSPPESPARPAAEHLLDLEGLRSVIQLLDRIAQRRPSGPPDVKPSGTATRDPR
jgi:uncharacterized protein DUF5372